MKTEYEGLSTSSYSDTTSSYSDTAGNGKDDLKKLLIGALAGAVVGSFVGSLYTEKGTKTRRRVSARGKELTSNLKDKVSTVTDNIAHKLEATKDAAADLVQKGKQKIGMSSSPTDYNGLYSPQTKGSNSNVLLGILAASGVGAAVWTLTTEKGKDTRRRVVSSSKSFAENVKEKIPQIKDKAMQLYNEAKEGAEDLFEKQKQKDLNSPGNTAHRGPQI